MIHSNSHKFSSLWLTAICIAMMLNLSLTDGGVSADEAWTAQTIQGTGGAEIYGNGRAPQREVSMFGGTIDPLMPDECNPATDWPAEPSNPSPGNGVTGVTRDRDLDWDDAARADWYEVYFGKTNLPHDWGSVTSSNAELSPLDPSTHYYWKVVAWNECMEPISGPVWEFTTACFAPNPPSLVSPANHATGVSVVPDLDWNDVPGAISYDVYFGTTNLPKYGESTTSSSSYPGQLHYNTHYYWKIVVIGSCGDTSGSVWDFTTQAAAVKLHLPLIIK